MIRKTEKQFHHLTDLLDCDGVNVTCKHAPSGCAHSDDVMLMCNFSQV